MTTYYHVYSESGFESWHRADAQGVTGAGRGTLVAEVAEVSS